MVISNITLPEVQKSSTFLSTFEVKNLIEKMEGQLESRAIEETQKTTPAQNVKTKIDDNLEQKKPSDELKKQQTQEALACLQEKTWQLQKYLLRAGTYPMSFDKTILETWT